MQPTRTGRVGIVDLLDRILDKGLILNADLIISLAGVPLIGVSLRAAIAGVETMQKYGMMKELLGNTGAIPYDGTTTNSCRGDRI